jgi:hypothetical protein
MGAKRNSLATTYSPGGETHSDDQAIKLPAVNEFVAEMDDFAQCIMNNQPSKVSGENGPREV